MNKKTIIIIIIVAVIAVVLAYVIGVNLLGKKIEDNAEDLFKKAAEQRKTYQDIDTKQSNETIMYTFNSI